MALTDFLKQKDQEEDLNKRIENLDFSKEEKEIIVNKWIQNGDVNKENL